MNTVPDQILDEIQRVEELIGEYDKHRSGGFAGTILRHTVAKAKDALMSGDASEMVMALEALRGCE